MIEAEIRKAARGKVLSPEELLAARAQAAGLALVHPAADVLPDGRVFFGVPVPRVGGGGDDDEDDDDEGRMVFIVSGREALARLPGAYPRHTNVESCEFSPEATARYMAEGGAAAACGLFRDLRSLVTRFVVLRPPDLAALLAAWLMATYLYRGFAVFPYLQLRSAVKRCGKSRLLKLLALLGFNCHGVSVKPTPAVLYREIEQSGGIQCLDEVEHLAAKDEKTWPELAAILLAGFERGGSVTRCDPDRGNRLQRFDVYAPRAFAAISSLRDALEDRALPIMMIRRKPSERIERLSMRTIAKETQGLRDRCYSFALEHGSAVFAAVEEAARDLGARGLDDRAIDLWAPLIAIARVVDQVEGGGLTTMLLRLAQDLSGAREAAEAETTATKLVGALTVILGERKQDAIEPMDLLRDLRIHAGFEWLKSTKALATLLAPYGLYARQTWVPGQKTSRRAYHVTEELLEDLRQRYWARVSAKALRPD